MLFSSKFVGYSLKSLNNNPVAPKLSPIDSKLNFTHKFFFKAIDFLKNFKPILSVKINFWSRIGARGDIL